MHLIQLPLHPLLQHDREDEGHTMTFGNVTTQADVSRSILSWIVNVERSSILIARQHPKSRWELVDGFILLPDLLDTALMIDQAQRTFGAKYREG